MAGASGHRERWTCSTRQFVTCATLFYQTVAHFASHAIQTCQGYNRHFVNLVASHFRVKLTTRFLVQIVAISIFHSSSPDQR